MAMEMPQTIGFRRRHLPHWTVTDRHYFVTIRLKGSLPVAVADELRRERDELAAENATAERVGALQKAQFRRIEAILDSGRQGPKHLGVAAVADVVFRAFAWLESERGWEVSALTVMPNHVHALMRNIDGRNHLLSGHLGVLKGYTAREANRVLRRSGPFWMDENFDHWCRSPEKVEAAVKYIMNNPVTAGLVQEPTEWPWIRVGRVFPPDTMGREGQAGMPDLPDSRSCAQDREVSRPFLADSKGTTTGI